MSLDLLLDAHQSFLVVARDRYAPNASWSAPVRRVHRIGREEVIRHLAREAGGMHDPEYTFLRRSRNDRRVIDEFAVRFVFAGEGIDNAPAQRGDYVELKRVRVIDLEDGLIAAETCVENWTILRAADSA